jgi:hypothetical protein
LFDRKRLPRNELRKHNERRLCCDVALIDAPAVRREVSDRPFSGASERGADHGIGRESANDVYRLVLQRDRADKWQQGVLRAPH